MSAAYRALPEQAQAAVALAAARAAPLFALQGWAHAGVRPDAEALEATLVELVTQVLASGCLAASTGRFTVRRHEGEAGEAEVEIFLDLAWFDIDGSS